MFLGNRPADGCVLWRGGTVHRHPRRVRHMYGDTRVAPRFPHRATHNPSRAQAPRVRPPPTRYTASLPLYQPPRPPSLHDAPRLSVPMRRAPHAPGASRLGPCDLCGKYGHLWRQCPQNKQARARTTCRSERATAVATRHAVRVKVFRGDSPPAR